MENLQNLFEKQINELYSAEDQLLEALPKMKEKAKDDRLKEAIESHLEETKNHKMRIEQICDNLNLKMDKKKCKGIEALIDEANSMVKEAKDEAVKDVSIIAGAQQIEHYEMAAYGTAVCFAKKLGHHDVAEQLQTTLDEEFNADQTLSYLAENNINQKAVHNS